jgi:hypothetical protein
LDINPTLNVVMAYEDFDTGKHAKKTYDFLVENLGHECHFNHQMWKFEVLSIPKLREMAAKDAAMADIIIISCRGTELPGDVKAWIELWLTDHSHPIALVALFEGPSEDVTQARALRSYLQSVARRGQMEFFAQPDWSTSRTDLSEHVATERGFASDRTLSALAGVMKKDSGSPRWGINE